MVVDHAEWLQARKKLLEAEKKHTRDGDALAKARAEMPMTRVTEEYVFVGEQGEVGMNELFDGKKQLLVYHLMFHPSWDAACKSCSFLVDNLPHYHEHFSLMDTTLVVIARAPWEKVKAMKERMEWRMPIYSSNGSSFNYDYHVNQDESIQPMQINYRSKAELQDRGLQLETDNPGLSVFFREEDEVFHTYSTYARGLDSLLTTFTLLDLTPLGRQMATPAFPLHDLYV